MRVLIFGDSTAQGYYDLATGGWANLLFLDVMKHKVRNSKNLIEIFNVSVSGDTTKRISGRLSNEIESRRWENEPIILIFAVGINDTLIENGKPLSTLETYLSDLEELYAIARPLASSIIFVGLESVNEAESNPWIFNSGSNELLWANDRIKLFDKVLEGFAKEKQVYYVSIFNKFVKRQQKGKQLHADGLHPNELGHQIIFQEVKPVLDEAMLSAT